MSLLDTINNTIHNGLITPLNQNQSINGQSIVPNTIGGQSMVQTPPAPVSSPTSVVGPNAAINQTTQAQNALTDYNQHIGQYGPNAPANTNKPTPTPTPPAPTPTPTAEDIIANTPEPGMQESYSTATGQRLDQPVGTLPPGYQSINPAIAGNNYLSEADAGTGTTIRQLSDGTYVRWNTLSNIYAGGASAQEFNQAKTAQNAQDALRNLQNGILTPGQQSQVDAIQAQLKKDIDTQNIINANNTGAETIMQNMWGMGQTGMGQHAISYVVQNGADAIAKLQAEAQSAIAKLKSGFQNDDMNLVQSAFSDYQSSQKGIQDGIDKMNADIEKIQNNRQTKLDAYGYSQSNKYIDAGIYPGMSKQEIDTAVQNSKSYKNEQNKKGNVDLTNIGQFTGEQLSKLENLGLTTNEGAVVSGIMKGTQPPLVGYGANSKEGIAIRSALQLLGYDYTKASLDYQAVQKFISSNNSPQQVRMKQAENSVKESLPALKMMADKYVESGFKFVNKADLIAAQNGAEGPEAAKKAQELLGQISLITDELGQTFMGGNSPTDKAFELAAQVLKGDFTMPVLKNQIDLLEKNLQYRENSWNATEATGSNGSNQYNQGSSNTSSSTGGMAEVW